MSERLNYFTAIKFLFPYIKRHKRNVGMFYSGWVVDKLLSMVIPILFGVMIDEIVYYQNTHVFLRISLVLVLLNVFSCLLYFLIYAQHHYLTSRYAFDIKRDVFEHLQKCDAQQMASISTGDLIETLQWRGYECVHFIVRNIIHFANDILISIMIIIYLFMINIQIGLFILIATPISIMINAKFGKKIRAYGDEKQKYTETYMGWLFEMLPALRDIRILGAEKKVNQAFKKNQENLFQITFKTSVSSMMANNMIQFVHLVVKLTIFSFVGWLALTGDITVGLFIIILAFFTMLTQSMERIGWYVLDAQTRISYIQYIYDFLQTPTENARNEKKALQIKNGQISFKDITFSYEGEKMLFTDFNLTISPGERFALVGKSGSGKTTLAYMLLGFYQPQAGDILIDGQKISAHRLKSIRREIGLVAQDVLVFDGTIRENLLLGNKHAQDEDIILACKQAGIWDFIQSFQTGLDTVIGIGGTECSGGQKQRIAIARIYLKNPKIIIFDEATSALDDQTEREIHEAWRNVLSERTAIVISHRESAVMLCDKVAILENGKIKEVGIPQQMKKESHVFKDLFAIKEVAGSCLEK